MTKGKILLVVLVALPFALYAKAQPFPEVFADINGLDVQLVNGSAPNEGRVLIRWLPDSPWTAVCFDPYFGDVIPFQMCRRLGYPFACGQGFAGTHRTDNPSLGGVASGLFLVACSVDQTNRSAGGCSFIPIPSLDPSLEPPCTHDQDMWLSCGYAGMPDFELRLVEGSYQDPVGLLQGRCSAEHEWSTICGNEFYYLKQGRVACRELGYSDYALSAGHLPLNDLDAQHQPNYTLFVDIGCVGNETSLTECQLYSLRQCESYVTLECYTAITVYDYTAYLCGSKQLCSDQCEQNHPIVGTSDDKFHYCQCDDACGLFDDCCYDYARKCSQGVPSLRQRGFTADQFACVWVPGSQFTHIGYVTVSRCPISWTDTGTRDLCERPVDIADVIGSMPVYDEHGVDFKNIYCAVCHGRSLERLKRWDVFGSDSFRNPSLEQFHSSLNRTLPSRGWFISPPQEHAVIRECSAHLVDSCLDSFRKTQLEEACKAYYAPVKLEDSNTRYRNPHCAMCNGRTVVPGNSCMDQVCPEWCEPFPWGFCMSICSPYDDFLTIEVLFDLSSSSSIAGVSCSEGQIYDPFLERCRVLTCAAGYQITGDECVVAPMGPATSINGSNALVFQCLLNILGQNTNDSNAFETDQIHTMTNVEDSTLSLFIRVDSSGEALEVETKIDAIIAKIKNESLQGPPPFPCNISNVLIFLPFALNGSLTCSNSTVNGEELFPGQTGTLLIVTKYQNTLGEQEYSKEKAPRLCLKISELNCSSLLTLEDFEYRIISDNIIEVIATGKIISASEYVLFPDDGTTVVCSFIGSVSDGLEPQIRRALSFAGSILSLFALAATFATYCVFSELRNDAGKSIMNLVVALFTAMLLFLLSGYLGQNDAACEFGAVVAHFTWLAAFFWMTMLAGDVARTLTSKVPRRNGGRTSGVSRTLMSYICLAWGTPLVVVSVCLVLQHCDCTSLPVIYAEGGICWITDVTVRLVVFIGPVAMTLVLNVCLFLFTAVSVRRSRHATKVVRNQEKLVGAREELVIYAKLCALVGVTWVFGFISQSVTGILAFSYIYIILNYLQGIFIFIAFCLNKRVQGLWRDKMRRRRGKPRRKVVTSDSKQDAKESSMAVSTANELTEESKL